jgi:hypothetical protein
METKDLISALNSGDNVEASNAFTSIMADRINSAMDDKKVQLGQAMMSGEEEQIEMDFESEEEVEENEDVLTDQESDDA